MRVLEESRVRRKSSKLIKVSRLDLAVRGERWECEDGERGREERKTTEFCVLLREPGGQLVLWFPTKYHR